MGGMEVQNIGTGWRWMDAAYFHLSVGHFAALSGLQYIESKVG
jgi:hypothetical protein